MFELFALNKLKSFFTNLPKGNSQKISNSTNTGCVLLCSVIPTAIFRSIWYPQHLSVPTRVITSHSAFLFPTLSHNYPHTDWKSQLFFVCCFSCASLSWDRGSGSPPCLCQMSAPTARTFLAPTGAVGLHGCPSFDRTPKSLGLTNFTLQYSFLPFFSPGFVFDSAEEQIFWAGEHPYAQSPSLKWTGVAFSIGARAPESAPLYPRGSQGHREGHWDQGDWGGTEHTPLRRYQQEQTRSFRRLDDCRYHTKCREGRKSPKFLIPA